MKMRIALIFLLIFGMGKVEAQSEQKNSASEAIRQYWFVLLTKGPRRDQDSTTAARLQSGHLANMRRLYADGKLKVAGPFGEDGDWQGIFIFDCPTREEVIRLLKTDPAIAAGRLLYDVRSWYTMAAGSFTPGKPKDAGN